LYKEEYKLGKEKTKVISNNKWVTNLRDKAESKEEILRRYKQEVSSTGLACLVIGFLAALYIGTCVVVITLKILEGGI